MERNFGQTPGEFIFLGFEMVDIDDNTSAKR